MAVRHSPERGWISNHNKSEASPPRWSGGSRADPEASPRSSALTERSWTARLPTARLPFCEGGGGEKRPSRFNRTQGFVLPIGGNWRKTGASASFSRWAPATPGCTRVRIREPSEGRSAQPLVFPRHEKQQRAAPTWPDSGDGAPVEAQHGSYPRCAIVDSRRAALGLNATNVFNAFSDTMPRELKCRSSSL